MAAPYRIYGESKLRVGHSESLLEPGPGGAMPPSGEEKADEYFARLLKLIPSEVIALYLVGRGLIPKSDGIAMLVWTVIATLGVVVVRILGTRRPDHHEPVQWWSVLIATISLLIWIYSLGDVFEFYGVYKPHIASLLVLTWTFFVPYFYRGQ